MQRASALTAWPTRPISDVLSMIYLPTPDQNLAHFIAQAVRSFTGLGSSADLKEQARCPRTYRLLT
jgi:hypothetical protein